ncbi:ribose-5-phosphate isomerase RpiA [Sphingomonas phyllosphaerae]|uniref:ribose-5-phosphate isomerase RpiA n=1 Tax=Sphingomonas phyllosphaerae TaxID=257003 RepID=UPI000416420F|nr:ribose-5-phosphate isomerase RpiA [Sphingomonas phyllosphaerae]
MTQDDDKRAAAEAAVAEVQPDMLVGLGTGSTVRFAIEALGRRVAEGLRVTAVATSVDSATCAAALGIVVRDFAEVARVDLTIDGADEIDDRLWAIKGAGGAMLREKIVAAASTRMVVIADASKRVAAIGAAKLPIEVLPFARGFVIDRLAMLDARVTVRDGVTDNGNLVLDALFADFSDPRSLAMALDATPGVLGHGLFLDEVDATYVADGGIVTRLERVEVSV